MNKKYIERMLTSREAAWVEIREAVKIKYKGTDKEKYVDLIELRYEKKMDVIPTCRKIHISYTTYYAWREEILSAVAIHAAYKQLIKP